MTQNPSRKTLLEQAHEKLDRGEYEAALKLFQPAMLLELQNPKAWYGCGLAYYRLKDYKKSVEFLDRALLLQPDYILALARRGLAYQELQQNEEASADFEKAIKIEPQDYEDWRGRGIALDELKRHEEAIASYDKAIEIKPDYHSAWFNRGYVLRNLEKFEEAIASCDKAIEIKPDKDEAWNNRGYVLDNFEKFEEAIASFDKAIEIKPDKDEAWNNRGVALGNLRRFEEAIASFDKAIEIKPDFHLAWYNRGIALGNLGRFEEAIASFDKAIEFQPDCYETWNNWDLVVKQQQNPFPYWLKAKETCTKALEQLTFEQFPSQHLTVLQYLLKICSYLGDTQTFNLQLEKGRQQLDELLRRCDFETQKINLERKFAAFTQLRVDILAKSSEKHQQIAALETAEKRKNTCLSWLREGWGYDVPSPNYQQMQQLLNPKTAAIYWHISPLAITTFILIYNQDLQVHHPPKRQDYPAKTDQIDEFETWFKEWKSGYQTYRNTPQTLATKAESPWRTQISSRLEKLREILDIKQIVAKLPPQVNKLILIPHRDLHLLPLHYLFSSRTIAYLPSFQIGLHLQQRGEYTQPIKILNVENPRRDLPFATIQNLAISQLHPQWELLQIPPLTKDEIIQKLAGDRDAFNFTGHGYHDIEQPQNSALLLANLDKLTLEDIFSQSNNLDFSQYSLICLCACESGIASQQNLIDEYVGLVSAFLAKRASCVVSTLWNVDEQSTALLMIQFYTFIAAGETPAIALKKAQNWLCNLSYPKLAQWYLNLAKELAEHHPADSKLLKGFAAKIQRDPAKMRTYQPPFEDPYHWAGFILTGKI